MSSIIPILSSSVATYDDFMKFMQKLVEYKAYIVRGTSYDKSNKLKKIQSLADQARAMLADSDHTFRLKTPTDPETFFAMITSRAQDKHMKFNFLVPQIAIEDICQWLLAEDFIDRLSKVIPNVDTISWCIIWQLLDLLSFHDSEFGFTPSQKARFPDFCTDLARLCLHFTHESRNWSSEFCLTMITSIDKAPIKIQFELIDILNQNLTTSSIDLITSSASLQALYKLSRLAKEYKERIHKELEGIANFIYSCMSDYIFGGSSEENRDKAIGILTDTIRINNTSTISSLTKLVEKMYTTDSTLSEEKQQTVILHLVIFHPTILIYLCLHKLTTTVVMNNLLTLPKEDIVALHIHFIRFLLLMFGGSNEELRKIQEFLPSQLINDRSQLLIINQATVETRRCLMELTMMLITTISIKVKFSMFVLVLEVMLDDSFHTSWREVFGKFVNSKQVMKELIMLKETINKGVSRVIEQLAICNKYCRKVLKDYKRQNNKMSSVVVATSVSTPIQLLKYSPPPQIDISATKIVEQQKLCVKSGCCSTKTDANTKYVRIRCRNGCSLVYHFTCFKSLKFVSEVDSPCCKSDCHGTVIQIELLDSCGRFRKYICRSTTTTTTSTKCNGQILSEANQQVSVNANENMNNSMQRPMNNRQQETVVISGAKKKIARLNDYKQKQREIEQATKQAPSVRFYSEEEIKQHLERNSTAVPLTPGTRSETNPPPRERKNKNKNKNKKNHVLKLPLDVFQHHHSSSSAITKQACVPVSPGGPALEYP
jgi:hypothetical protein